MAHMTQASEAKERSDTAALFIVGAVLGVLLPLAGFIIGAVVAYRGDRRGVWLMVGSIGMLFFWFNAL